MAQGLSRNPGHVRTNRNDDLGGSRSNTIAIVTRPPYRFRHIPNSIHVTRCECISPMVNRVHRWVLKSPGHEVNAVQHYASDSAASAQVKAWQSKQVVSTNVQVEALVNFGSPPHRANGFSEVTCGAPWTWMADFRG